MDYLDFRTYNNMLWVCNIMMTTHAGVASS